MVFGLTNRPMRPTADETQIAPHVLCHPAFILGCPSGKPGVSIPSITIPGVFHGVPGGPGYQSCCCVCLRCDDCLQGDPSPSERAVPCLNKSLAGYCHDLHRFSRWLTRVLSRFRASESQIGFPKVFALPIYDQTARSPFFRRAWFSGRSYQGCGTAKSILLTS
jgi:hypothetical protein